MKKCANREDNFERMEEEKQIIRNKYYVEGIPTGIADQELYTVLRSSAFGH